MVVDYLMNILSVLGQKDDGIPTHKRTRDDVLWSDARTPFRRSPFWLVLKVAIQRTLAASFKPLEALKQYKMFMVFLVARILEEVLHTRDAEVLRKRELEHLQERKTEIPQVRKAELLQKMKAEPVPAELIATVHMKLARRVQKLERQWGELDYPRITAISRRAKEALAVMWQEVQDEKNETISRLPLTLWEESTFLSLEDVRPKLIEAMTKMPTNTNATSLVPTSQARLSLDSKQLPSLARYKYAETKVYLLADFEQWVENNLKAWSDNNLQGDSCASVCTELAALMKTYWNFALSEYSETPLEMSVALLTVLEMWVVLDGLCLAKVPLLREFSPELSHKLLEPLLLPKLKQMQRLLAIENYIKSRDVVPVSENRSIFADTLTCRSFSVRYYDSSTSLQDLRASIEQSDADKRMNKIEELATLTKEYNKLVNDASKLSCGIFITRRGRSVHSHKCTKCSLNKKAGSMTIVIDEKSLPEDSDQLKAVVFELAVPAEFAAWRDATWMVVHDVAKRGTKRAEPPYVILPTYRQLSPFVASSSRQPRITFASKSKPFLAAHYRRPPLPVEESSVCVNSGLTYAMWDRDNSMWLGDSTTVDSESSINKVRCVDKLPGYGPYANLQWAYATSHHEDNATLARQNECHRELDLREYVAFGSLRAGERLQWLNMLRELGCSNLNHNALPVNMLFHQAACEAGTHDGKVLRTAHAVFGDASFCMRLISVLQRLLTSIETNWNEQHSMSTTIFLTSRLLSLTSSTGVVSDCLQLLRKARSVTFSWCRTLRKTHFHAISKDEGQQQKSISLLLGAALLCFSTFDVEEDYMNDVLNSTTDLATAAEIQNIINDHLPNDMRSLKPAMRQSLLRRYKLAHTLEPRLRALVASNGIGLNQAIQALWDGASLESEWNTLPNTQWLWNTTVPATGAVSQTVHYNILTGALLVAGSPVGSVPDTYKMQPVFQRIFGSAVLSVFAYDMPGMLYRVSRALHGNEVSSLHPNFPS